MWRFLNNIPRVFRQYVHSPRPSAGCCTNLEEDERCLSEKVEEKGNVCPFTGKNSQGLECFAKRYFNFAGLSRSKDNSQTDENGCDERCRSSKGEKNGEKWWQSYQKDFWTLVQNSNRMLEALAVGTASVWGTDTDRNKRKLRLLYRVLWAVPGSNGQTRFWIKDQGHSEHGTEESPSDQSCEAAAPKAPHHAIHRAIKDAAGAAHDAKVNESVTETLDSAIEEFQSMCEEYTHRSESLLGIEAAEKGDMKRAVRHLYSACMLGNTSACFNLGLCYETGSGVAQNIDKAKKYYSKAASCGHSLALYNLGLLYLGEEQNGCREQEKSCETSCSCQNEPTEGKTKGLHLLEKAARAGLAEAQTYLGIHHMEEDYNPRKAAVYFKAAADQNDSEAQYFLAVCYEHGLGVEKNECRAAQLYSLAASAGHETALYNLGVFNENGLGGLPVDLAAATELYTKAAKLGVEQAKTRLEEIQSENKAYQADENTFESMYELFNKDVKLMSNRPLSPSQSSPTLLQDLSGSFQYFEEKSYRKMQRGYKQKSLFDPGGDLIKENMVKFSLGQEEDGGDLMQKSMLENNLFEGQEILPSSNNFLHRSFTSPNLAYVTLRV